MKLPPPRIKGHLALEACLAARRSVREYSAEPLSLAEVAQLLWAAQGLTSAGHRTAPSAGALYPLEVLLIAGNVIGAAPGIYRYDLGAHELHLTLPGDHRAHIAAAALEQDCVRNAAALLAFAAVPDRTTEKYGERGLRYVEIESGHAAQNVLLQAVALGLGAVPVGAFSDAKLKSALKLRANEEPLYLVPVGRP